MIALSTAQPYPGLRPFDLGDQDFFFGRDAQIRGLRGKLRTSRLIAVVGRSGCGKSSLVRAGLIPTLLEDVDASAAPLWQVVTFRPQGRPIAELTTELLKLKAQADSGETASETPEAAALRRSRMDAMLRRSSLGLVEAAAELGMPPAGRLLIVVDQFEEIFRYETANSTDTDEATAFVRLLLSAAQAASPLIHVLLTMRLDFLGDCARFQGLPEALSDGQFLVPNLNRAERREAIEKPALQCGYTVSPALTQRLLNEIGDDPEQLPVLQHVLMRTWQEATGANTTGSKAIDAKTIELAHYNATGGLQDAISLHADIVLTTLTEADQRATERVFKALSDLDRRGRAIRRPQRLSDLAAVAATDGATVMRIVEAFRAPENCFLMPPVPEELSGATLVDISHESLLRRWAKMIGAPPQHDGWLVEEDRDGKTYRSLLYAAEPFADDPTALLPPALARQRQAWWQQAVPNLEWAKRYGGAFDLVARFLSVSAAEAARLLHEEEQRRRTKQRWRFSAIGTAAVVVLIAVAVGAALLGEQQKAAEAQASAAEAQTARAVAEVALDKLGREKIENDRRLRLLEAEVAQARSQAGARQQEIGALQRESNRLQVALSRVQGPLPQQEAARQDDIKQTATAAPAQSVAAVANQDGYVWIGSVQKSNLQTLAGAPVPPTDVKLGQRYKVVGNTYLRQGKPDANYVQQPSIGVLTPEATVEAKEPPVPYSRPTGEQYWMAVRALIPANVASASLPTVYFQFATAPRARAELVSKELEGMGYKLPGEERVDAAQGKREVRYFYAQDEAAAKKLADDTGKALQVAGFPPSPPIAVNQMTDFAGKKNAPGVVELWLDLPAGAAARN